MGEPLRMFALAQVQQAEHRVFEGPRDQPWLNEHRHSLPPPAETPARKTRHQPDARHQPNREAKGISDEARARHEEIRRRLAEGQPVRDIASALGVDPQRIYAMRARMRAKPVEPATEPRARQQRYVMVAMPATTCTSIAVAARFAFEVLALPVLITRTACVSAEPRSTMYVLDWAARLARLEFDGEPGKGRPKRRSSSKGYTSQQLSGVIRPSRRPAGTSRINPKHVRAPALVQSQTIALARISPFDQTPLK